MKTEEMTVAKYNDLMMEDAMRMLIRRYKELEKSAKRAKRHHAAAQEHMKDVEEETEKMKDALRDIVDLTNVVFEQLRLPI